MHLSERLVLGTVQLGVPYGVNAANRILPESQAIQILDRAFELGVVKVDTAVAYGRSQTLIANWVKSNGLENSIEITTKIHSFSMRRDLIRVVHDLAGLDFNIIFHNVPTPDDWGKAQEILAELRYEKHVLSGVSCYDPCEVEKSMSLGVNKIQIQSNLATKNQLGLLVNLPVKYIFRSLFMKGLLLNGCLSAESRIAGSGELVRYLEEIADDAGYELGPLLLRYMISLFREQDLALIGFDNADQLDIINLAQTLDDAAVEFFSQGLERSREVKQIFEKTPALKDPRLWT